MLRALVCPSAIAAWFVVGFAPSYLSGLPEVPGHWCRLPGSTC